MSSNLTDVPFFADSDLGALKHFVHSQPAFYHTSKPTVFEGMTDEVLALVSPFVAYWAYSIFFVALDSIEAPWIHRYRIHESAEVTSRNRVTKLGCFLWVLLQQVIQTVLGLYWMDTTESTPAFLTDIEGIRNTVVYAAQTILGETTSNWFLLSYGASSVRFIYWWGYPIAQLVFAMFCIDTWQYFWHRAFHVNRFLYKHFHSWHHRLYVPYAYGALYNHPLEGFVLDTLGTGIAHSLSGMTVRQASFLFAFSTMKTIDDHCGYRLPLDPLQLFFGNNADYHDIHHQVAGIKSNFSQPFFIHWDVILGTRMTREAMENRQRRWKEKVEKST